MPVCYPGNGQKDDPDEIRDESRTKPELTSSPSLSPSQGDSIESSGSPSLSSPKESLSPHSPPGFMRNVKKRESKGKSKETKGMNNPNVMTAIARLHLIYIIYIITESDHYCFIPEELTEPSSAGKPKRRFPDFG